MSIIPLRLWRVALWGTFTFILYCILFRYVFGLSITALIARRTTLNWLHPSPVLPAIISGVVTFLCALLFMFCVWKIQLRRDPRRSRSRFTTDQRNYELWIRLLLLIVLLAVGSSIASASHIDTCRCCLFSLDLVCGNNAPLPPDGFYKFSAYDGLNAGIYLEGEKSKRKIGNTWVDSFSFEQVRVKRTRFGWPLRAITRDVVLPGSEWHIVVESWVEVNLLLWFLAWLCTQAIINIAMAVDRQW